MFQASVNSALSVLHNRNEMPTRLPENATPEPKPTERNMPIVTSPPEHEESPVKGCIALGACIVFILLGMWKAVELVMAAWRYYSAVALIVGLTGCATTKTTPCTVCADYCAKFTDCAEFRAWHHTEKR